jgi:hypothetical protein
MGTISTDHEVKPTNRLSEEFPADPELSDEERNRYQAIIDFPDGWQAAFNYEQACLLRKRLNYLNASSSRIERYSKWLAVLTLVLIVLTGILILRTFLP